MIVGIGCIVFLVEVFVVFGIFFRFVCVFWLFFMVVIVEGMLCVFL